MLSVSVKDVWILFRLNSKGFLSPDENSFFDSDQILTSSSDHLQ